jgi:hypothetical protein
MNFKYMKEFIFNNRPMNINLFHFSHKCHRLGYSKESLSPMFSVFCVFLFETCFCDTCFNQMEMNLNKMREVFIHNMIV